ncbi:YqaA family protein [Sphingosinicella terrae]|jgi:membrane protein YqaA with SNARE-associated domain|uniref:YqaA family protein n=1 Tax=Sphingosinicella terrae TaxID=2172047 RepID=UPI000E0CD845|nr:YqaA family protein [Sphingosinicella terrae]
MFRALYDWTLRLAGHRHATRSLAVVSFCESSFFPIPPDVMLVPMVLARRDRAYMIATVCTVASVAGAIFGYAIGYFLFDTVGQWVIDVYHLGSRMEDLKALYDEWGDIVILVAGVTPIPFKLVTIASGFFQFNFFLFVILAALARGARFFAVAWLLKRYGAPMQAFIEQRLTLIGWAFLAALVGGFALIALI